MLQKLSIRNYAIIDRLTIEPDEHLNTVTGETGAGKSIILGALSLILGERVDTSVLVNSQEKSVVEGYFNVKANAKFLEALAREGLDEDDQCIIRREIAPNGKSRAFINDTPVNVATLNALTSLLVDLHQQFGHLALEEDDFQVFATDAICGTMPQQDAYSKAYKAYRKLIKELQEKKVLQEQQKKDADYQIYLLEELKEAALQPDEVENAAALLRQMSHSERIAHVLTYATEALDNGEVPMLQELRKISNQLQSIADLVPAITPLQQRLNSAYEELKDVVGELDAESAKVTLDPEQLALLQQRVDIGYRLMKKHAVATTADLLALQVTLQQGLKAGNELQYEIEDLEHEAGNQMSALVTMANELSAMRRQQLPAFIERMNGLLVSVGMPNARFDVKMETVAPGLFGIDEISFLLDANKSGQLLPLQKAASGGEMSRIMLCLKSLTARALHMPTLIFDEVDTGISGEAARQVGALLRELAQYHQVICITHQPQVAARGTKHFFVYKQADASGRLTTQVRTLNAEERVVAIARMIGGETPSDAAISNARELVAG